MAYLAAEGILQATRAELFKFIPGHERQYAPAREYLFKTIQPKLEDALLVGTDYEEQFASDKHD